MFRDIFKGLKKEVEKRTRAPEETKPIEAAERGRYGRLAAWIKTRYGSRFRDGSRITEVEAQLNNLFSELEAKGTFKEHPKIANGFRAYISQRQYGDLVRVTE